MPFAATIALQKCPCDYTFFLTFLLHRFVSYLQKAGYDFLSNMQVFDPNDWNSIYFGLIRVFEFDDDLVNKKIAEQVCCIRWMSGSDIGD